MSYADVPTEYFEHIIYHQVMKAARDCCTQNVTLACANVVTVLLTGQTHNLLMAYHAHLVPERYSAWIQRVQEISRERSTSVSQCT